MNWDWVFVAWGLVLGALGMGWMLVVALKRDRDRSDRAPSRSGNAAPLSDEELRAERRAMERRAVA
jgi:hypothetical protein